MGYLDEVLRRAKTARDSTSDQALALGKEFASNRSQIAGPKPTPTAPVVDSPAPVINPKANYGNRPGEMRIDTRGMTRPLGSFKKGTDYVPKTGVYKLHEGEKVVPAKENKMDAKAAMQDITGKKSKPAKKIKEIRTRKTDDGKFVHTHLHHNPEHHQDEMHVSNDLKEAQQHISDHEANMTPQAPPPDEAAGGEGMASPGM
jgi:hypothetical protein